jgi:hypothetical protein
MYTTIKNDLVVVELSPTKHDQMISIVNTLYEAFSAHLPTLPEAPPGNG